MNTSFPAGYQYEVAKLRIEELVASRRRAELSKQSLRRTLACGLRKLADRVEPAPAMRIPTERQAA